MSRDTRCWCVVPKPWSLSLSDLTLLITYSYRKLVIFMLITLEFLTYVLVRQCVNFIEFFSGCEFSLRPHLLHCLIDASVQGGVNWEDYDSSCVGAELLRNIRPPLFSWTNCSATQHGSGRHRTHTMILLWSVKSRSTYGRCARKMTRRASALYLKCA